MMGYFQRKSIKGIIKKNIWVLLVPVIILGCKNQGKILNQPNLIVIYTDDQRFDAVGVNGPDWVKTPTMDSLANNGINFTNAFVTFSLCTPSRAALLTGRYNSVNGVTQLSFHYGRDKSKRYDRLKGAYLNGDEKTFAHLLKEGGYQTALIGKWHLEDSPKSCGFDYTNYFHGNGPYYGAEIINNNGDTIIVDEYVESYISNNAIHYIEHVREKSKPFVLFYNTRVPHMAQPGFTWHVDSSILSNFNNDEIKLPESYNDDLSGKPPYIKEIRSHVQALKYGYRDTDSLKSHIKLYYGAVEEVDKTIGKLLNAVKENGLSKNTYVILMGDNGWFLGEHMLTSKILPYEESIHVPLIITGPNIKSRTVSEMVLNIDIAPTLLEMANLSIPSNVQGKSLITLFDNWDQVKWRKDFIYEVPTKTLGGNYPHFAIRTKKYKYIATYDPDDSFELVFEELYNLKNDPYEKENLIVLGAYDKEVLLKHQNRLKELRIQYLDENQNHK